MASRRGRRPCCIQAALSATSTRAGFWKRGRNALHRLRASPKRSHADLAEGVWREVGERTRPLSWRGRRRREARVPRGQPSSAVLGPLAQGRPACQLLDPHPGLEDTPAPLAHSLEDWSPADLTRHRPSHALKPRSQVRLEDPLRSDVPGLLVRAAGGALAPDDVDMRPAEGGSPGVVEGAWGCLLPARVSPEPGRGAQGRARVSRQPPRLGSERDRGHRLALNKRKLELFLSEPERKRRRQRAA